MTKFILFFALLIVGAGCHKEDISAVDYGTLAGQFRLQPDPVRCTMPTTSQLTIQPTGASTYRLDYDRYGMGVYSLTGVTVSWNGSTTYELRINGQTIGQYALEETPALTGSIQKKWILSVRYNVDKPEGLDFMGVKI